MKQHVGMGFSVCPVCGKEHDETVLIQRAMGAPPRLEHKNFTGFSLCPEHKKLFDEGYFALVVASYVKEGVSFREQFNSAVRTGDVIHIRRSVAKDIFNVPIPDDQPMTWVDPEVAAKLKSMMPPEPAEEGADHV
jgi:hypothetical protein